MEKNGPPLENERFSNLQRKHMTSLEAKADKRHFGKK